MEHYVKLVVNCIRYIFGFNCVYFPRKLSYVENLSPSLSTATPKLIVLSSMFASQMFGLGFTDQLMPQPGYEPELVELH